ncbi:hypothetical protein E2P81_ATG03149 [Venturia nashicola]|nr:hypothetical protein E2P81_ATG03149 [Venturia nashicola]
MRVTRSVIVVALSMPLQCSIEGPYEMGGQGAVATAIGQKVNRSAMNTKGKLKIRRTLRRSGAMDLGPRAAYWSGSCDSE